jgi:uncharacterized membrane protein (UPF0136 family)
MNSSAVMGRVVSLVMGLWLGSQILIRKYIAHNGQDKSISKNFI